MSIEQRQEMNIADDVGRSVTALWHRCSSIHNSNCRDGCSGHCCGSFYSGSVQYLGQRSGRAARCCDVILFMATTCLLTGVCSSACQAGTNIPTASNCSSEELSPHRFDSQATTSPCLPNSSMSPVTKLDSDPSLPVDDRHSSVASVTSQGHSSEPVETKSAVAASTRREEDDNISKVVAIAVPFTCVIILAGTFFVTCKLCHRYRCYKKDVNLRKCLTFCDSCMSTSHVFQVSGSVKDQSQTSSATNDSKKLFRHSFHSKSPKSRVSKTSESIVQHPQSKSRQTFGTVYVSMNYSNSSLHSNISRQGSSRSARSNVAYTSAGRPKAVYSSSVLQNSGQALNVHQSARHAAGVRYNSGRLLRQSSRSSGHSFDSGHSFVPSHLQPLLHVPLNPQTRQNLLLVNQIL